MKIVYSRQWLKETMFILICLLVGIVCFSGMLFISWNSLF